MISFWSVSGTERYAPKKKPEALIPIADEEEKLRNEIEALRHELKYRSDMFDIAEKQIQQLKEQIQSKEHTA